MQNSLPFSTIEMIEFLYGRERKYEQITASIFKFITLVYNIFQRKYVLMKQTVVVLTIKKMSSKVEFIIVMNEKNE
jgi:hypothetical protein